MIGEIIRLWLLMAALFVLLVVASAIAQGALEGLPA